MIAFQDFLPLILLPDGRTLAFEQEWLTRLLGVAADRAGCAKWWMAEHVACSIDFWMRTHTNDNVILSTRFVKAVRDALEAVGYGQIGFHFEQTAPFHRISLLDVAREAGTEYELGFFQRLVEYLQRVIRTGSTYCELHDLEHCVKFLCNRKTGSRQCESLRREIVTFARTATQLRLEPTTPANQIFLYVV